MSRTTRVSARFSPEEQALLIFVAVRLQRTKSDTIRILIREKALELQRQVKEEQRIDRTASEYDFVS